MATTVKQAKSYIEYLQNDISGIKDLLEKEWDKPEAERRMKYIGYLDSRLLIQESALAEEFKQKEN